MPDESDLRRLFATTDAPNTLDADRIVAKVRARRLPRQLGAGLIGTLAVAGIGVVGVQSLIPQQQSPMSATVQEDSAGSGAPAEGMDTLVKRAPAEKLNLCGGPLAEVAPSFYSLQVDVAFPATAPATGNPVAGVVRLTNLGSTQVTGTTAPTPAVTLSQGGIVLWHSTGPVDSSAIEVDLAPGASLEYPASFTPVRCDIEDDLAQSFRAGLPAVPAGGYELSAAIDFVPGAELVAQDTPGLDLVTGPRALITMQ